MKTPLSLRSVSALILLVILFPAIPLPSLRLRSAQALAAVDGAIMAPASQDAAVVAEDVAVSADEYDFSVPGPELEGEAGQDVAVSLPAESDREGGYDFTVPLPLGRDTNEDPGTGEGQNAAPLSAPAAAPERSAALSPPPPGPAGVRGFYGGLYVWYYKDLIKTGSPPHYSYTIDYESLVAHEIWTEPISISYEPEDDPNVPHPDLEDPKEYGVIWEGLLLASEQGVYTFSSWCRYEFPPTTTVAVDDGLRLYIDDEEVINQWDDGGCNVDLGGPYAASLATGQHDVRVEFLQTNEVYAGLILVWDGPGFSEELIPVTGTLLPDDQCNSCEGQPGLSCSGCAARDCRGGAIDTLSGNHSYQVTDMSVPIVGGVLTFERTYASQHATATSVLGFGWTHNFSVHLHFSDAPFVEEGQVIVTTPDGSRLRFYDEGGTYEPYPGIQGTLVRRSGAAPYYTYVLTSSTQVVYTFDNAGYLKLIRDPQGHTTTLSYSGVEPNKLLDKVTGPSGERYLDFSYDSGYMTEVQDHTGRKVSFGYDQSGDLTVVTDTRGFVWTYSYTGTHLLYEVKDSNDHLVEKTDYDDQGRAVRQWEGDEDTPQLKLNFADLATTIVTDARDVSQTVHFDPRRTWTGTEDPAGNEITRTYDLDFNLMYTEDANGNPTGIGWSDCGCRPEQITNALGLATTMDYDDQNNLTEFTDARDNTTSYDYDDDNNLISTTNALNYTTYYTYSENVPGVPDGLLIETKDPRGNHSYYRYNGFGEMTASAVVSEGVRLTTTYTYDSLGRMISTTSPADRTTVHFYDPGGYLTRTVENCTAGSYQACKTVAYNSDYPDRNVITEYKYDGAGNRTFVTNTLGVVSYYAYDAADRLIQVKENYDPGKSQNEDDVYNITTEYGYDAAGNQTHVTDTLGMVVRTFYDDLNRPIKVVENFKDGTYSGSYPDQDVTTLYEYDAAGNLVKTTNTLGVVTYNEYNELNQLSKVVQNYDTSKSQNEDGVYNITTEYGYDEVGNQNRVTDTLGMVVRTLYDELNRPIKVVENYQNGIYDSAYPDEDVITEYAYDAAGNQIEVTDPLGVVTLTDYDELNRPITVTQNYTTALGLDQNTYNLATGYAYDKAGNLLGVTDPRDVVTRYKYDALNRVVKVTENYAESPGLPGHSANVTTEYEYDGLGNRVAVIDPEEIETHYHYDALNRVVKIVENYDNSPGLPENSTNITTEYEYDSLGNRQAITNPEGIVTRYDYDELNRVITVTANYTASGVFDPQYPDRNVATAYTYNGLGQRTRVINTYDVETYYLYDDLGRVIKVVENNVAQPAGGDSDERVTTSFTYNGRGDRIAVEDPAGNSTSYGYDALSRLTVVTDTLNHTSTYTYDAAGNRLTATDPNGNTTSYTYDPLGRPITVTNALGYATAYSYDALGNRIATTDAKGIATRYDYDALSRLITVTENYQDGIYSAGSPDEDVITAYGYDKLGNLLAITNALGYTTTYTYDDLSRLQTEKDPLGNTWTYAYDRLGRTTQITDPTGISTTYSYDALGRPLLVDYGNGDVTTYYKVDALGNRLAMTDAQGVSQYAYDDLSRPVFLTRSVTSTVVYTVGYSYDARGLRTALTYPDATVVSYTYDAAWRLTGVEEGATSYVSYSYDDAGRLTQASFGNAVHANYTYDAANRLTELAYSTQGAPAEFRASYGYSYDQVGNRTRAVETVIWAGDGGQAYLPGASGYRALAYSGGALGGVGAVGISGEWTYRPTGLAAPLPFDPPPIVRLRASYRASFDAQGLSFHPRRTLFAEEGYFVAYGLTTVKKGNTVLFHPGSPHEFPIPEGEDRVVFSRGDAFVEEYLLTPAGVEQRFVFLERVEGEGDLVIEGNLTGNLQPTLDERTGEVAFRVPGTGEVPVTYGRAIVEDAAGERIAAPLELDGVHLRIVVPGDWLARAVYPVVVDPLIGTNFAVSTQPISGDHQRGAVASAGDGAYLVAWHGDGSGDDVYAQLLSSDGALISETIPVDTRTSDQLYPDVAANSPDSEYVVVYQHDAGRGVRDWDIYAQRVASDGVRLGDPVEVYTGTYDQQYPAVAFDETNARYLAVWRSYDPGTYEYGIYGQLLYEDAQPYPEPAPFTIYTSTSPLDYPDVAFNVSDTQYLAVWQAYSGTKWVVAGRRVSADGSLPDDEPIVIASLQGNSVAPAVTFGFSETQYLVAFQGPSVSDANDILGQLVNAGGTLDGSAFLIATGSQTQGNPDVTYAGASPGGDAFEYLVTWEQSDLVYGYQVRARRVSSAGQLAGTEIEVCAGMWLQRYPAVAYENQAGEYLAVWQDKRDGSEWDIYAQRLAISGTLRGGDILVSAEPADDAQEQAAVAYGSREELHLVVWQDDHQGNDDIYAQLVSGGGALVGEAFTVTSRANDLERTPAVAYNETDDEFLVVWKQQPVSGTKLHWDVYGQRVDGDGDLVGISLTLCTATGDQTAPAVAYNTDVGYFLVAWEDKRSGNYDVYARAVDGDTMETEFAVVTGTYDQRYPDVAANDDDGASTGTESHFLVVYQHDNGTDEDVYAQRTEITQTAGAAIAISTAANDQQHPAVAYNESDDEYLVAWQHYNGTDNDVHARRVGLDGSLQGTEKTLVSGNNDQERPDLAWDEASTGYAVVWEESNVAGPSGWDIHGAVLDEGGQILGEGTETLSEADNSQERPAIAYDDDRGRFLAVWGDYRNDASDPDVYAQLYRGYTVVLNYTYDGLYRLTGASYSDGAYYGYGYDAVGNRTVYTDTWGEATAYAYDAADRISSVTQAGVQTSYSWSARGELLSDGVQGYTWDAAGRLTGVSGPGNLDVSYLYDGDGNRTNTTVQGGDSTDYYVDPFNPVDSVPQVLVEKVGSDSTRFLYGLDLAAQQLGGATVYYGYDALSVRMHLDGDAEIAAVYRYGPFGEEVGEGVSGYGFSGEAWQEAVGLLYLRARYYRPAVGRFLSRDTWGGKVDRPRTLQSFLYVVNNPVRYRDPSGHRFIEDDPDEDPGSCPQCRLFYLRWPVDPGIGQLTPNITQFYSNEHRAVDMKSWDDPYRGLNSYPEGCHRDEPYRKVYAAASGRIGPLHAPDPWPDPHNQWYLSRDGQTAWILEKNYMNYDPEQFDSSYAAALATVRTYTQTGWTLEHHWELEGGQGIKIEHARGYTTWYWHVRAREGLEDGEYVTGGEHIGYYDLTGYTFGPHLHFVLERNGEKIDPLPYFVLPSNFAQ